MRHGSHTPSTADPEVAGMQACVGRPPCGLAFRLDAGMRRAGSGEPGPSRHVVLSQSAECHGVGCVCRCQTSDVDRPTPARHRQTVARGPQRPERGPKTSDPSELRGPSFAVKDSTLTC